VITVEFKNCSTTPWNHFYDARFRPWTPNALALEWLYRSVIAFWNIWPHHARPRHRISEPILRHAHCWPIPWVDLRILWPAHWTDIGVSLKNAATINCERTHLPWAPERTSCHPHSSTIWPSRSQFFRRPEIEPFINVSAPARTQKIRPVWRPNF